MPAAARSQSIAQAPIDLSQLPHDSVLLRILSMDPGVEQSDSLGSFEQRHGREFTDELADVAEDPSVPSLLRANAVLQMSRRKSLSHFVVLRPLLAEKDKRIRLATVMGAREYLAVRPAWATALLAAALADSSVQVQARALEGLTDRDVPALRRYVAGNPPRELAEVARGLLAAAEERGAPLVPDATGKLSRVGPDGWRLDYQPRQSWHDGEVTAGALALVSPSGPAVVLDEAVEVVKSVVPAFFSSDGRFVVYEKAREIRVRQTAGGKERNVGPGLAPRPLPFTDDFVFLRAMPDSVTQMRTGARLQYQVLRASFASADSAVIIGHTAVNVNFEVAGGASPVRWMRIVETNEGGAFQIVAEGMDPILLPGLIEASARER